MVVKEYRCMAHGDFESADDPPLCPFGCDTVVRQFLTAPGMKSDRTRNIDSTLQGLAKSHGMTDIQNRGGQAAKRANPMAVQQQQDMARLIHERYGDGWGAIPKGGTLNVKTGQVEGQGPGVAGALAQHRAGADNVLAEVKEKLVPKPVMVRRDHENLSIADARPPA